MSEASHELRQLASRIFGEEMPPAPSFERETLIVRTEALLNARSSFEHAVARGPIEPAEDERQWEMRIQKRAFEFFMEADRLFAALIGKPVFEVFFPDDPTSPSPTTKRRELTRRLMVFKGLLSEPGWGGVLRALTSEIRDMDGGDQPTVLAPERRNPGQARQPTKVARMRLRALCWHEHLKSKGVETSVRQNAVAGAYRTAWDTIRKWRDACEAIFGEDVVAAHLRDASFDWFWSWEYEGEEWATALEAEGTEYYEDWRDQRGKTCS